MRVTWEVKKRYTGEDICCHIYYSVIKIFFFCVAEIKTKTANQSSRNTVQLETKPHSIPYTDDTN